MAKPNVTFTVEPRKGQVVTFQLLAPATSNREAVAQAAFLLKIRNRESAKVSVSNVRFTFFFADNSQPYVWGHPINIGVEPDGFGVWHTRVHTIPKEEVRQPVDFRLNQNIIIRPGANMLKVELKFKNFDEPVAKLFALRPHESPTDKNAYAFPAKTQNLLPNEFWHGAGANHDESEHGCQLFALDLGVSGWDADLKTWSHLKPKEERTGAEKNEHHRVWEKPIYAMAGGKVIAKRWNFPDNDTPGVISELIRDLIDIAKDGNGNYVKIATGDEIHLYAHFKLESLPQKLRTANPTVEKGELLGLVGNSGSSGGPHLHVGVLKRIRVVPSPVRFTLRPMPFTDMYSINSREAKPGDSNAPWFKHTNHGLSQAVWPERCLIWPAPRKPRL